MKYDYRDFIFIKIISKALKLFTTEIQIFLMVMSRFSDRICTFFSCCHFQVLHVYVSLKDVCGKIKAHKHYFIPFQETGRYLAALLKRGIGEIQKNYHLLCDI